MGEKDINGHRRMIKYTVKGMYDALRQQYLHDYKGHFIDMYEGHNHADRMATRYAIKNVREAWRNQ